MLSVIIRYLSLFATLILLVSYTATAEDDDASREIIERIRLAKSSLASTQNDIEKQSLRYSRSLNKHEREISSLRESVSDLKRLSDEKVLGIEDLQKRVELWQTQSSYQKHLINSYLFSAKLIAEEKNDKNPTESLNNIYSQLEKRLANQWHTLEVVTSKGVLQSMQALELGPVTLAHDETHSSGGIIEKQLNAAEHSVIYNFKRSEVDSLATLRNEGRSWLLLDPTLGNATRLNKKNQGFISHVGEGGFWAIPIITFGFVSLIIALLKAYQLQRLPKINKKYVEDLAEEIGQKRKQGKALASIVESLTDNGKAQHNLAKIALSHPPSELRDNLSVAFITEFKHKIERYLGVIAMAAAVAPLLGLLGTVSGMIETFKMMSIFGASDPATVSGGISEALVTTELGLIVAIPSLLISALLSRKTRSYIHDLDNTAIKLSKLDYLHAN